MSEYQSTENREQEYGSDYKAGYPVKELEEPLETDYRQCGPYGRYAACVQVCEYRGCRNKKQYPPKPPHACYRREDCRCFHNQ